MKWRILILLLIFAALSAMMMLGRLAFLLFVADAADVADFMAVALHGAPLDFSIAGYATIAVGLLLSLSLWTRSKWVGRVAAAYFAVVAAVMAACIVLNMALYPYWQFPLDATPLFYFLSSPADALASVGSLYVLAGVAACVVLSFVIWFSLVKIFSLRDKVSTRRRLAGTIVLLLLTAALLLPIRGGVTVSTMNTGRAYFSDRMLLNHAAVNPVLSLMESLLKDGDFGSQYRFMSDADADRTFREIMSPAAESDGGQSPFVAAGSCPDVVMLILEGFSSHLMATLGGESGVAPELDSIGSRGLLFTNFYACSFRTDRGLVAVLSGFPSQPTSSVMKYPRKTAHLPGIAKSLRKAGYSTTYYYGGDADFTNMRSYLRNTGFQRIVSDADFPISARLSKWGVHDHVLMQKIKAELLGDRKTANPRFCVVQTSSSHEPFDVPFSRFGDVRKNAFCYADSVVGDFVRAMARSRCWENTLLIIVPDHMGGYPDDIPPTSIERYRIPLIMSGGALQRHGTTSVLGDQTDIAATLLGALRLPAADFTFSKDLFDSTQRRRAWFSFPDLFGWIDDDGVCIYDNASGRAILQQPPSRDGKTMQRGKACLQKIYDWLAE